MSRINQNSGKSRETPESTRTSSAEQGDDGHKNTYARWVQLFLLKARFAMTSALATLVDYVLYLLLVDRVFEPVAANTISFSTAVIVNFLLQKHLVFSLKRSARRTFLLAMLVSLGGLILSNGIIAGLSSQTFFAERQYLTKLITTGVVFFYNFYLKRYAFEKRFF